MQLSPTTRDSLDSLEGSPSSFAAVALSTAPVGSSAPPVQPQTRTWGSSDFRRRSASRRTASTPHPCSRDRPSATVKRARDMKGFTFTGREYDAGSGMYYYRARWYEPPRARFISSDPLPQRQLNGRLSIYRTHRTGALYIYVAGNPISRTDANGLGYLLCTLVKPTPYKCVEVEGCPPTKVEKRGFKCEYACPAAGKTRKFNHDTGCGGGSCPPSWYVNADKTR